MKKLSKNKKGFTLVETLLAIIILIAILMPLTFFFRNIWITNTFVSDGLMNADSVRKVFKTMVTEIRGASTADTGAYTIALANAGAFTFYSNIDDDILKEKVRYFLNGTTLEKGVLKPTGSPLTYNPANEVVTPILYNVTDASIFSYYSENYDGTTPPLNIPLNVALVRLIKITLTIDRDPLRPPSPTTFSTQISIRSLKDNL